jgi:hypothetical protein
MMLRKCRGIHAVWYCCRGTLALLLPATSLAVAQGKEPAIFADELVRKTVANELAAADIPGHYMYRLKKETPQGSQTREMIETRNWLIGRPILINGQPLRPAQQQREDARLRELLSDPAALQALQLRERQDEQRVRRIIRALPDAFVYDYSGAESEERGNKLVRLKFLPNPNYKPPSRELSVLREMEGTMLIDGSVDRLVRVDAKLVSDVKFGWGILGRLFRGGSFLFEQRDVGSGRWAITTLEMHFSGKMLLFRSIHIDSVRTASDFRRMPDNLTLEQGLTLLLQQDGSSKRMLP